MRRNGATIERASRGLLVALVLLSIVGCDLGSKTLAARALAGGQTISLMGNWIRLEYRENAGAFLGLGAGLSPGLRFWLLTVGVGAVLAWMLAYLIRKPMAATPERVGLVLIVGGGIGNLVDRVTYGHVRDFAVVGIGELRTGVFNVADSAILAGGLILLAHFAWTTRRRERPG